MLRRIIDHPFLYGTGITLIVSILLFSGVVPFESSTSVKAVGLIVFGSAIALLLHQTRDRDDVFWFFLGGVTTLVAAFVISLKA